MSNSSNAPLSDALLGIRQPPEPDALATVHRRAVAALTMLAVYGVVVVATAGWYALDPLLASRVPDALIVGSFLITAAAFASWKVAAYRLVPVLSGEPTDRSTGWAAGGYVVPIMNLWVPFQIMREIRDAVDPDAVDGGFGSVMYRAPPIHVWWALWIAFTVGSRIFNRIPEPSAYDVAVSPVEVFAIALLMVQLAVTAVAFVVVWRIDQGQQELAARLQRAVPTELESV